MGFTRFTLPLMFLLLVPAVAGTAAEGELHVSDPFPVKLTFDRAGKPAVPAVPRKPKRDCSGLGLVEKINCVAKAIENAGEGGGGSAGSPAKPPISITMSGVITPKITIVDDDTFLLTFDVAIPPPKFSPSRSQIPGDVIRKAVQDERSVKQALKSWQKPLKKSALVKNPRQNRSFDAVFSGLSLFQVRAPDPDPDLNQRVVKIYWEDAQCKPLEQEFLAAQRAYEEALSAMPVLKQFELVTRTLDEITDTLGATAKGLTSTAGKIGEATGKSPVEKKLGELMVETKGLSESFTGALEKIQKAIKKERTKLLKLSKLGKPLKGVQAGLKKSAATFKKVSKAAADINKKIRMLESLVRTADASPSEQLRSFKEYFEQSRELVGGLVKAIPGLGVFLDLYAQAIGQIADSAEQIEAIVEGRKKLAKELGIPSPYITLGNARDRAAREQRKLYQRVKALTARLVKMCPGVNMTTAGYDQINEMEDAAARGRHACRKQQPTMSAQSRMWRNLQAARIAYYKDNEDTLRPRYRKEKARYDGKLARYRQLLANPGGFSRKERGAFLKDVKTFYTEAKRIAEYRRVEARIIQGRGLSNAARAEYRMFLKRNVLNPLKRLYSRLQKARKAKKTYLAAKQAHEDMRARWRNYSGCVKKYVRQLAARKGWDQRMVDALTSY